MRVVYQAIGERDGVLIAQLRVVKVQRFKVDVVVQRVSEPDGVSMADIRQVLEAGAARDVLRLYLGLATLASTHDQRCAKQAHRHGQGRCRRALHLRCCAARREWDAVRVFLQTHTHTDTSHTNRIPV